MAEDVKRLDRGNETIETLKWEPQVSRFPVTDDKAYVS